jgi:hypothetical protein
VHPSQPVQSGCCSLTRGAGPRAPRLARLENLPRAAQPDVRGRAGTGLLLLRAGVPPARRTHLSLGAAIMRRSTGKQERVVPRGLEPRTLRLLAVRSNQLSYETSCRCSARGAVNSSRSWASPRAGMRRACLRRRIWAATQPPPFRLALLHASSRLARGRGLRDARRRADRPCKPQP